MSAKLFFLPYQTATVAGIAAPGAKLYFYNTGTTTPLPIYTTNALSVEHTNPVVANGAGRFADIYLDSTKTYRLIVKDKNGSTLDDIDPYLPGTAPDASSLQPYADDAADSATAASASATAADASADAAATSETNANNSADDAATSAAEAAASADAASSSIASVPNATAHAATRAALAALNSSNGPAYLRESGREGMFVWDSSNLSAMVTADPNQGIYVAPASATSGASGAWVRKFSGRALSTWWGVSPTATAAANTAAFNAALETLRAMKVTGHGYGRGGSIGLHTPAGNYQFNAELQIKHAAEITGDYTGMGADGTNFIWTVNNTHGFHAVKDDGVSVNAHGFKLKGFNLSNSAFVSTIGEYHAVFQNAKGTVEDIFASNWPGDGVYAFGDSASDGSNVNGSIWRNIQGQSVRWTLRIAGGDANGGASYMVSGISCRAGALFDNSFLGNGHYGGWAETVGLETGFRTRCSSGGHVYCVAYGQEAWCSANAPTGAATSNQGWLYYHDDAVQAWQPTWTAGQTWYFSAPFASQPGSATNSAEIKGVYIEGNCNPAVISDAGSITLVDGPIVPVWTSTGLGHGGYIRTVGGVNLVTNNHLAVVGNVSGGGAFHYFGQQTGTANTNFYIDNSNFFNFLNFRSWNAGVSQLDGYIRSQALIGLTIEGKQTIVMRTTDDGDIAQFIDGYLYFTTASLGINHQATLKASGATGVQLQYNGTTTATIGNGLVNLAAGVKLQFNGTDIINSSGVLQAAGFPSLAGDVTTSAGSLATTIANGAVTLAKQANMATASVVYRKTAGPGPPEVQTLATLKTDLGLTGTNSGDQTITLTGDVTGSGTGSFATAIGANKVTYAQFQQVAANSLVGNPTGSLANAQGITLAGGLAFSGTTLTAAGALTPTSVASTGAVTSSSASAGVGYATGAGGTVTQLTSRTTGVTLSKISGAITLFSTTTAAGQFDKFTLTNTAIAATDVVNVCVKSATANYIACVLSVAAGSCVIGIYTPAAVGVAESPVINFAVLRAVAA